MLVTEVLFTVEKIELAKPTCAGGQREGGKSRKIYT